FDLSGETYKKGMIPIAFPSLAKFLKKGERMLFDDGRFEVKITKITAQKVTAKVVAGGKLFSHKGVNVPDSGLDIKAITEKDEKDLEFGVKNGVDLVALSFVRTAEDILDLRFLIKEYERKLQQTNVQPIRIIAKIERQEAVKNIKEILAVVDGIMIARGDLGIEIPAQEVPLIQKQLVDMALEAAKPVIVATQMLDSMQSSSRPTRAEVSDVANAVIDHTDAVMLSNETATGKYPVEAVETMARIISRTEESVYDDLIIHDPKNKNSKVDAVISLMSRSLAEKINAKVILAASFSGETGRLISRYRPEYPIVVATSTDRVCRQLNLSWGIVPFVLEPCRTIEELVERSLLILKKRGLAKIGDNVIVVAGEPVGQAGHVNLLEVREVH
ncbi:MAG TPA: pyruvate kinase, partial [Patescibacteria group bacterium]|nr:pyruvate kinase [Patescibacteria group bacterium]